jgi:GNAT superfamily N-acetyltransferase
MMAAASTGALCLDAQGLGSWSTRHVDFRVTSSRSEIDLDMVHRFLSEESSWARSIPRAVLERAMENSLCFGGFVGRYQVAFARVVTDQSTFANLADVFVLPEYRSRELAKVLLRAVLAHPDLPGLRRFTLATGDAHGLYRRFGFEAPLRPQSLMERYFPAIYLHPDPEPAGPVCAGSGT